MLKEIRLEGFKSYGASQQLPLAPLTVLIGANASGKSNAIEALQLLAWLARSHRLGDLSHALREGELPVRGRPSELARGGTDLALGCKVANLELTIRLRLDGAGPRVVAEELNDADSRSTLPYYRVERPADEHGSELVVAYNNFSKGHKKPHIVCIDQQAVFTQLLTPARFEASHERSQQVIPPACATIARSLGGVLFLDPSPRAMRGYSFRDEKRLDPNGANVSAVLAHVCEVGGQGAVLEFVRTLPEQDISAITFLTGPRSDVMLALSETFGGVTRSVDAAVISDGTLRVLAIAAAVLSANPGSLVVIEEIDNGVHPSRARDLMGALHRVASARQIQLLVTTHNPALLDAIPGAALGDTVACYRDPVSGESRLQRLADLEDFVPLTARGPLGVLATSGVLDRFLKRRRTEKEREEQGRQTLELLRSTGTR